MFISYLTDLVKKYVQPVQYADINEVNSNYYFQKVKSYFNSIVSYFIPTTNCSPVIDNKRSHSLAKKSKQLTILVCYNLFYAIKLLIYKLFVYTIRLSCATILFLFGWKIPNVSRYQQTFLVDRQVFIYSHSSYYDFFIMLLYFGLYFDLLPKRYILMNSKFYSLLRPISGLLGLIEASPIEEKNNGRTNTICQFLASKEKFIFFISPKGTTNNAEWRSGYFWIAHQLKALICVGGIDYNRKVIVVRNFYKSDNSNQRLALQNLLKNDMSCIMPLHPEKELSCGTAFNKYDLSVIDPLVVSNVCGLYGIYRLLSVNIYLALIGILVFISSTLYHRSYEEHHVWRILDRYFSYCWLFLYILWLINYRLSQLNITFFILSIITTFCYYQGIGREKRLARSDQYYFYHTMFHIMIAITLIYPL